MNILIVGNGFDLSHYLPTKYDHFMVAMAAIEKWDESKGEMGFDDLFKELYEKEDYFFGYTKAIYQTEAIKISVDQIKELKKQLKENCWYQYFSDHVKEVKTWIDFETKIEDVLVVFTHCIADIERLSLENKLHLYFMQNNQDEKSINLRYSKILDFFQFTAEENYEAYTNSIRLYNQERKKHSQNRTNINAKFCYGQNIENGFNAGSFLSYLNDQLEDFIELFNFYLEEVVKELKPKSAFQPLKSDQYDLTKIDQIYSFNYTQTYLDFYNQATKIDFLHGRSGEKQNMVLGVSELKGKALKKIKAYGFTKYHQKLMKDTDYNFLILSKNKINNDKNNLKNFETDFSNVDSAIRRIMKEKMENESKLNMNINILGHSLDISDQEYIIELFSLNDDIDRNVRVIVYYFNDNAKFSLLANLLHILKKEKVEHWMKQGWLKFEKNPNVAQLNQIQPVELAKNQS
ncbi:bacteriophage abortive infection AbiH family protein [Acinetobacter sp. ME22]|uniref:AbiH family protein n=1 Tax=Acinetobacter sp. ME22 TaxID=2904802 RepID=UPI001EDB8FC5|nr:AbiH family protein [Acinetobacter sp. ME22]MCG2573919.1 bacteriophage abortive infection AbiH family protein [Acinetobacter sp. ME22]